MLSSRKMSLENEKRAAYFILMSDSNNNYPERVVLYDGVCALCNTTVKFLLKFDRRGLFFFAPLQGETADKVFAEYPEADSDSPSVIFMRIKKEDGEYEFHHRSDAFIAILRELGGAWRLVANILFLVPRSARDRIYDIIATYRYRWFGKYEACPVPPAEVRDRFLP